jgi:hypothetical protein
MCFLIFPRFVALLQAVRQCCLSHFASMSYSNDSMPFGLIIGHLRQCELLVAISTIFKRLLDGKLGRWCMFLMKPRLHTRMCVCGMSSSCPSMVIAILSLQAMVVQSRTLTWTQKSLQCHFAMGRTLHCMLSPSRMDSHLQGSSFLRKTSTMLSQGGFPSLIITSIHHFSMLSIIYHRTCGSNL